MFFILHRSTWHSHKFCHFLPLFICSTRNNDISIRDVSIKSAAISLPLSFLSLASNRFDMQRFMSQNPLHTIRIDLFLFLFLYLHTLQESDKREHKKNKRKIGSFSWLHVTQDLNVKAFNFLKIKKILWEPFVFSPLVC